MKRKITASVSWQWPQPSNSTWCLLSSILQLIWSMINSVGGQIFQDSRNIGCKHTLNNEKQQQMQKYKSNKKSCQVYNIFICFWELQGTTLRNTQWLPCYHSHSYQCFSGNYSTLIIQGISDMMEIFGEIKGWKPHKNSRKQGYFTLHTVLAK